MPKLILGLLITGLFAGSQGGCGGGAATAHDASTGGDGPAFDGAHPGDFIAADVDGITVRAELMPAAGTKGVDAGQIWATAGTTSNVLGWNLYVTNAVGTSICNMLDPIDTVVVLELAP
jgi:hypothetical protein